MFRAAVLLAFACGCDESPAPAPAPVVPRDAALAPSPAPADAPPPVVDAEADAAVVLRDIKLRSDQLAAFRGNYQRAAVDLVIELDGDQLYAMRAAGKRVRLLYQGKNTFVPEDAPGTTYRFPARSGAASEVEVGTAGKPPITFRRLWEP